MTPLHGPVLGFLSSLGGVLGEFLMVKLVFLWNWEVVGFNWPRRQRSSPPPLICRDLQSYFLLVLVYLVLVFVPKDLGGGWEEALYVKN